MILDKGSEDGQAPIYKWSYIHIRIQWTMNQMDHHESKLQLCRLSILEHLWWFGVQDLINNKMLFDYFSKFYLYYTGKYR